MDMCGEECKRLGSAIAAVDNMVPTGADCTCLPTDQAVVTGCSP